MGASTLPRFTGHGDNSNESTHQRLLSGKVLRDTLVLHYVVSHRMAMAYMGIHDK